MAYLFVRASKTVGIYIPVCFQYLESDLCLFIVDSDGWRTVYIDSSRLCPRRVNNLVSSLYIFICLNTFLRIYHFFRFMFTRQLCFQVDKAWRDYLVYNLWLKMVHDHSVYASASCYGFENHGLVESLYVSESNLIVTSLIYCVKQISYRVSSFPISWDPISLIYIWIFYWCDIFAGSEFIHMESFSLCCVRRVLWCDRRSPSLKFIRSHSHS